MQLTLTAASFCKILCFFKIFCSVADCSVTDFARYWCLIYHFFVFRLNFSEMRWKVKMSFTMKQQCYPDKIIPTWLFYYIRSQARSQPVFSGKPEGPFCLSYTFIFRNERNWMRKSARVSEKLVSPGLTGLQVATRLDLKRLSKIFNSIFKIEVICVKEWPSLVTFLILSCKKIILNS